jgi:DNA-binding transcriptional LysR family regulator
MTVRLDDMRLFAELAEAGSFTGAARRLGVPKQTLSRRIAALEHDLGIELVLRSTRKLRLTGLGRVYAARCRELASLASEANEQLLGAGDAPRGQLRITADPTFGESYLPELIAEYVERYAEVEVEVVLTSRRVDLIEEGFDLAFRIGRLEDSTLVATRLSAARLIYCAAPSYLERHGAPREPSELSEHAIIEHTPRGGPSRWPGVGADGQLFAIQVKGRVRLNSLALVRDLAVRGFGIANLPEFACTSEIADGRLCAVLEDWVGDVGGVWLVRPPHKLLSPRVRSFVELALARLRPACEPG